MDEKINRIKTFYNLLMDDTQNDFFLFPFMELAIEVFLDFKLISDRGMGILSRDIDKDFQNLNNNIEVDKSRLWICLYFMCVYHLSKCYVSFVEVLMEATEGKYFQLRDEIEVIDADILIKLNYVKGRAENFIVLSKNIMDIETKKIEDDTQAKLFDEHKRKCIDKPNYFPKNPLYVPAELPA
jgi:hypothetical protein